MNYKNAYEELNRLYDKLQTKNQQLQNNWNELKEWAKTEYYDGCIYSSTIIKKMQEIESGVDNESN